MGFAPQTRQSQSHPSPGCFPGKRHSVKVTPMQPLSVIIGMVASASKQQLDPAVCTLHYKGKTLDLSTPVRFASLPTGATLELRTGERAIRTDEGILLGGRAALPLHACGLMWHMPHTGKERPRGLQGAAPKSQEPYQPSGTAVRQEPSAASVLPAQSAAAGAAANHADALAPQHAVAAAVAPLTDNTACQTEEQKHQQETTAATGEPPAVSAPAPAAQQGSDPLSLGRPIFVFEREAAAAAEASRCRCAYPQILPSWVLHITESLPITAA